MKRKTFSSIARQLNFQGLVAAVCAALLLPLTTSAQVAGRQVLQGHVPAAAARLLPLGNLPSTNELNLAIGLPLRNREALTNLLRELYDPASPNYQHYLTPEQFTARFGPTEQDYAGVIAFARAHGLRVTATYSNRVLVDVSGPVADIEQALHVRMRVYEHPTEQRLFHAPDAEPSLDLAVPILSISGLDDYALPRPRLQATPLAAGQDASPNAGSGPGGGYMGKDFRAAYVPDTSRDGSGQAVGLLQFDGYNASDIAYYENLAGLPSITLSNVLIDGASGHPSGSGGEVEVSLDIEMAISMATNLSQVVVYMAPNPSPWEDLLNRMANDNLAKQLSCSWYQPGGASNAVADAIFQQMAAQGQSFFNASGDYDAYTGLIDFPGDTPYLTQVGGTSLTMSGPGGSRVSETVWNRGNGIGSGGGISTQYPIPSWQTNINMTANQGSTTKRNTPDVALTAENVYVRANGLNYTVGGTSCSAPLWAGFAALVNQQATASGRPAIGFINPLVDAIGTGPNYTMAFHDITTGNNTRPGSSTRFYAVSGYDLCTGWGTPAGQNLIDALANPEALLITPASGFASIGGVGGPFTITSQSLSLTNAGTNSLSWSLVNTSLWLNASPGGGALTPGGPATLVTVSLNSAASNLVVGSYSATVCFTNLDSGVGQDRQFSLSVISPPTMTQQPADQAVLEGAPATFSVGVTGGLPLSYQWQDNGTNLSDGGNISGSTTTNLTVSDVSSADVGIYSVIVSNAAAIVISSNALLTITPSPPVITTQPANQAVGVDGTVQFMVSVVGSRPLFYQWSFNETNIDEATNVALTLTNVQFSQAGNYAVLVTNRYGPILSSNALLTVIPCDPAPSGLIGWWSGEGNLLDSVGTNNGILQGGLTFGMGEVGQDFVFNGTDADVKVPANTNLNVGVGGGFTIEAWINPSSIALERPIVEWNNGSGYGAHFWISTPASYGNGPGCLYANLVSDTGDHTLASVAGLITTNVFQHVAVTYDQSSGLGALYLNGVVITQKNLGTVIPRTAYDMYIGRRPNPPAQANYWFGSMDEVSLYDRALSSNEIAAIYSAGSAGKCPPAPTPPLITAQPTNQTVAVGGTASFSVTAAGTPPLSYQWEFNGTNIVGASNSTYTLTNVQLTNGGNYSVAITNLYGSTNSFDALLTVLTHPPAITNQPTGQTVFVGGNTTFSVSASGTSPLSYQWTLSTTNLVGATNATLTLTNVQLTQAGNYAVLVTNLYGSILSSNALLTVLPASSCDPAPSGLVGWWSGEGNLLDSAGTNNGILQGGLTFGTGEVGQDFVFNGTDADVKVPANTNLNVGVGGGFTIEAWINPSSIALERPIVEWNNGGGYGAHFWISTPASYGNGPGCLYANLVSDTGDHTLASVAGLITTNVFQHVAVTYDQSSGLGALYLNGVVITQKNLGTVIPRTAYDMYIGRRPNPPAQANYWFGSMDEVSLYDRALSSNEIAAIYSAGSAGKCPPAPTPPLITAQPTNQTVAVGGTASFSVTAAGTPPLSYQWEFNGTNIVGASNSTYTLTNVQLTNGGNYSVAITNLYGSTNSFDALLTVLTHPPAITNQPTGQTVFVGGNTTFSVSASGTSPLSYQWTLSTTNLVGATNATLTLTNVQLTQAGNYAVLVTNLYGSILSSNALLTVLPASSCDPAPSGLVGWWSGEGNLLDSAGTNNGILQGGLTFGTGEVGQDFVFNGTDADVKVPANTNLNVGVGGGFTIEAWINPSSIALERPIVEWNNGSGYGAHFWISTPASYGNGPGCLYANLVSDTGDHTLASVAGLITTNVFQHVAVTYDQSSGLGALYLNGVVITQKNLGTVIPRTAYDMYIGRRPNPPAQANYWFGSMDEVSLYDRALSSNEIAAIYSAGSAGKCPPAPPSILQQPTNQAVAVGGTASFSVTTGGTPPWSYRWNFNGTNISGATNAWLTLTNVQFSQAGNYAVLVTNHYGSILSSNAVLAVGLPPVIITQSASQSVALGCDATFSVHAEGIEPLSYQWNFSGTNLVGATNLSLTLTNVQTSDFGSYLAVVANLFGSVTSTPAVLALGHPPVAGADTIYRFAAGGVRVNASVLLANDTDVDGNNLTIIGVSPNSSANGAVGLTNNWIYYAPPAGSTNSSAFDTFTYVLSDGHCGTDVGAVTVQVRADNPQPQNFAVANPGDGSIRLTFDGVPGYAYRLEYTADLSAANWQTLTTKPADGYGVCQFVDWSLTNAPVQFYRAVWP